MSQSGSSGRLAVIMRTSIIGIAVNALLAVFKMIIGALSGSIAIVNDGINNLSDAASSLITIAGAALAARPADKKHPFGYGRMEYLSSLVISGLVLYAGITAFIESVKKIISPEPSDYSTLTLIIVGVAVVIKLGLALYTQAMGRKAKSDSLTASGREAILDVAVSVSTLAAAFVYVLFNVSLEAYLGAVISVIIVKAGLELLKETVSKLLGEPTEIQLAVDVKATIKSFPEVLGAYDLVMNNYGPEFYMASVHAEVDEQLTAAQLDVLTRQITDRVLDRHGVYLTAIGFYSRNTSDPESVRMEQAVASTVLNMEHILAMHGFYVNETAKALRFDLVVSLSAKDRKAAYKAAVDAVQAMYPEYRLLVGFDIDYNELLK